MHVDVFVRDLDVAEQLVLEHGASKLLDGDRYRVYADPVGHPFCLYPGLDDDEHPGRIGRVVFDCPDPRSLASFYSELMEMPRRVEDSTTFVAIAREDERLPMLGFQHSTATAPRWPDPSFPEQVHLDIELEGIDDPHERVLALGATCLVESEHHRVYADPAGHPFCL
jgi:hypothetical protein